MTKFVKLDGMYFNRDLVIAVTRLNGDSEHSTTINFTSSEIGYWIVEKPIEEVMEVLNK